MSLDDLLSQGIAAAKAGQREQARDLLMQVVQQDQYNEKAWLWLSGVVDSDEDRCLCLENVLEINPDNAWARRGLDRLAPVSEPPTAPAAASAPQAQAAPAPGRPSEPAAPAPSSTRPPPQARPSGQELEEPRGFERLQEPRRKSLRPILIVLAIIAVPGTLVIVLVLMPITWRASINEKIGFPLLGIVSVDQSQTENGGRLLLKSAGPSSEFRKSRKFQVSGGDTVVIQYTVEVEQGRVLMSLNRDVDVLSEDFWSESLYDRVPWSAQVEGSQTQTASMTISQSGRYEIWLHLTKFKGQIDLTWQIE